MFKHQKILLTIGLILTAAMTAYVSVTPAKAMPEVVAETIQETENLETEETEAAALKEIDDKIQKELKETADETKAEDKKVEAKKESKAEEAAASKPSTGNKNNTAGSTTSNKNNTSSSASTTTKPSGNTTTKPSGNNNGSTTTKPSGSNTSASGTKPSTSKPSGSTSNNTSGTKPTTHTHTWVATTTTVHHDATGHYEDVVVCKAWDEFIYEDHEYVVCNTCGTIIVGDPVEHILNGTCRGYHAAYESVLVDTIHHPEETESQWVEDSAAWDETITTYKCSCGATK